MKKLQVLLLMCVPSVAVAGTATATVVNDMITYIASGLAILIAGLISIGLKNLAAKWKLQVPEQWLSSVTPLVDRALHYAEEKGHQAVNSNATINGNDKLNHAAEFLLSMTDDKKLLAMKQDDLKKLIESRLNEWRGDSADDPTKSQPSDVKATIKVVDDKGQASPAPAAATPPGGFISTRLLAWLGLVAIGAAVIVSIAACGALKSEGKVVEAALIDCTAKQTSAAVHDLRPLGDSMLVNALDNGKLDWGPVRSLAQGFASDVGRCVLADAVSRALKPKPADPNAPKISPLDVDRDALRTGFRQLSTELYGGASFRTESGAL